MVTRARLGASDAPVSITSLRSDQNQDARRSESTFAIVWGARRSAGWGRQAIGEPDGEGAQVSVDELARAFVDEVRAGVRLARIASRLRFGLVSA